MHQYQPSCIVVVVLLIIELIHMNLVFVFDVIFLIHFTGATIQSDLYGPHKHKIQHQMTK